MEPKIPTLKDSKKPQVKVRGLEAGVTLFDRLKQFKKKDLAFILAGLGTLFMAPLAEHFMMAPEGGDATLGAGMGRGGGKGNGIFDTGGNGSVGYDVSNGQAPGSAVGGGSDVITPLNVRDPSALVMGPGATQQPPTNSVAPATPPPTAPVTRSDSDLKDALAASARGVGGAAKAAKALLPVPKIALAGAGGLRGLGVANGGSSASSSLGPISSNGLASGKANTGGGMAGVKGGSNIKGVARGQSQGGGGLEALKAAANNAGDTMNRGAASTALDNAAAQAIPNGGGSFGGSGQGGAGANDKAESGNGGKDNKSTGESLEFLKQKAMQEKKIELWAKEQEAGDNKLELLKLRNSMAEAIAGKVGGAIGDAITCPMTKGFKKCYSTPADKGEFLCYNADAQGNMTGSQVIDGGDVGKPGECGDSVKYTWDGNDMKACGATAKDSSGGAGVGNSMGYQHCKRISGDDPVGGKPSAKDGGRGSVGGTSAADMMSQPAVKDLGQACKSLDELANTMGKLSNPDVATQIATIKKYAEAAKEQAKLTVALRDAVNGPVTTDCGASSLGVTKPLIGQQNELLKAIAEGNPADAPFGLIPKLAKALQAGDPAKEGDGKAFDPKTLPDSKTKLDSDIQTTDADVQKIANTKPQLAQVPSPADIKKVYATVYRMPADQQAEQVSQTNAVFKQVNDAQITVTKSAKTVTDIQKDLNGMTSRLDAASGSAGTVAGIIPIGEKVVKDQRDQLYKDQGFNAGKVSPIKLEGAGKANSGVSSAITSAKKDVETGSTAFAAYKEKYNAAADETAKKAVHDDESAGFTPTNSKLAAGVTSLNKARQAQSEELNSLNSTATADQKKLATSAAPGTTTE